MHGHLNVKQLSLQDALDSQYNLITSQYIF